MNTPSALTVFRGTSSSRVDEVAFRQNYVSPALEKRQVVKAFVNEVLYRNAACAIQGLGPLVYKKCKEIWEDVASHEEV